MKLAPIDAKVELSFHPRWMFKTFEEVKTLRAPLNSSPGGGKDKDAPFVPSFFKAFLTFSFFFLFQVSRRYLLALPRRALQRAGVAAGGPPADRDLPGGKPLPGLRRHRHFNLRQQEVLRRHKDRGCCVSTAPLSPVPCPPRPPVHLSGAILPPR